jgi:hypothetical protein
VIAQLESLPWSDALSELLSTYGLHAQEEVQGSGIIKISGAKLLP